MDLVHWCKNSGGGRVGQKCQFLCLDFVFRPISALPHLFRSMSLRFLAVFSQSGREKNKISQFDIKFNLINNINIK